MQKCKYADRYQGILKPRCNMGTGCDVCNKTFQANCSHPIDLLEVKAKRLTSGDYNNGKPFLAWVSTCTRCAQYFNHKLPGTFIMKKLAEAGQRIAKLEKITQELGYES